MKLIFLILAIFISQFNQLRGIDTIEFEKIKINGHLILGQDVEFLIGVLGKSDSVEKSFDPIVDEFPLFNYYFNESSFLVVEGTVQGFTLKGRGFDLNEIKVGDDLSILKDKYPNSFKKKYSPTNYEGYLVVIVNITNDNVKTDSYIRFWCDIQTNKITMIEFWEEL